MSSIVPIQLLMMLLMYFGTFICYYLPIKFFRKTVNIRVDNDLSNQIKFSSLDFEEEKQKRIYSNCNCVALGVFIGMCFMNIPMVKEEFNRFLESANLSHINYPISEFTIVFGFFLILFIEQIVIKFRSSNDTPFLHLDDELNDEQSCKLLDETLSNESILIDQNGLDANNFLEEDNRLDKNDILSVKKNLNAHCSSKQKFTNSFNHHHHHDSHDFHHHFNLNQFNDEINLGFFMLIFASSIHSVFEGLALGLITQFSKALNLFIGIFLHECIIAVALGINAAKVNKGILFGALFSLTIPIGILLGIGIGYTPGLIGEFISATMQGLATGTFLQVAFYELLPIELNHHQHPDKSLKKISLMFIGFVMMAFIQLISN